jgi:hypothetical protein
MFFFYLAKVQILTVNATKKNIMITIFQEWHSLIQLQEYFLIF